MNAPATVNGEFVPFSATVADLVSRLKPAGPAAWAAFVALGANPSQEALDVLRDVAANPDWRYRRCAIEAIALHPLGRSAEAVVCRALLDQSPYVVRTACNSASALGLSEAHDTILRLISSESAETREVALRALASLWHAEDFAPVFRIFQKDPKKSVRNRAAWTLIENVSPSTWRTLLNAWRNDPLPRHRSWACDLVERFGDEAARNNLLELLNDPDGHVRKAAQRATGTNAVT